MLDRTGLAATAAMVLCAGAASAQVFPLFIFENASGTSTSGIDVSVSIVDNGLGGVDFVWTNASAGITGDVTQVYVENTAFSQASLANGQFLADTDTDYDTSPSPGNPAGSIQFHSSAWGGTFFGGDPRTGGGSPVPRSLNPGESMTMRFDLVGGATVADVIAALNNPDTLRVAAHIQRVGPNSQSVWGVSTPTPGAAGLLVLGMGFAARRRRA